MSKFRVVALKTVRYEMIVEAPNEEMAIEKASSLECVAPEWREDVDTFNFTIVGANEEDD